MKKFRFPLDRVRRWRQEQFEIEELKLQRCYGQLAALGEEKARVEREREASQREVLAKASLYAGELAALDAYRGHVRSKIGGIEKRQQDVIAQIEEQRARVLEARRQAELLERLKTRMFDAWQAAAKREEETLAGELYLAKWRRR
jgi:flagellar export protein FliJ